MNPWSEVGLRRRHDGANRWQSHRRRLSPDGVPTAAPGSHKEILGANPRIDEQISLKTKPAREFCRDPRRSTRCRQRTGLR